MDKIKKIAASILAACMLISTASISNYTYVRFEQFNSSFIYAKPLSPSNGGGNT